MQHALQHSFITLDDDDDADHDINVM